MKWHMRVVSLAVQPKPQIKMPFRKHHLPLLQAISFQLSQPQLIQRRQFYQLQQLRHPVAARASPVFALQALARSVGPHDCATLLDLYRYQDDTFRKHNTLCTCIRKYQIISEYCCDCVLLLTNLVCCVHVYVCKFNINDHDFKLKYLICRMHG
jgi:hypothetical protein